MTAQLDKGWTRMDCLDGLQEKVKNKKNITARLHFAELHLKEEQMRPKWSCLFIMHSTTFGGNQTPHNSCQHGSGGIRVWASCSHWENLEKTGSGSGSGQDRSPCTAANMQQNSWKKKKKNRGAAVVQSPDLNLAERLCVHECCKAEATLQRRVDQNPSTVMTETNLRHKHQTCMEGQNKEANSVNIKKNWNYNSHNSKSHLRQCSTHTLKRC